MFCVRFPLFCRVTFWYVCVEGNWVCFGSVVISLVC